MQVSYINHMGDDLEIANAARVSFNKESKWLRSSSLTDYEGVIYQKGNKVLPKGDVSLINFLARGCTTEEWDGLLEAVLVAKSKEEAEELLCLVKQMPLHWTPFAHTAIKLRMSAPIVIRTHCFKHKQGFVENEVSRRYVSTEPNYFNPKFRSRPEGNIKQGSAGLHEDQEQWNQMYNEHMDNSSKLYNEMIAAGIAPEQARMSVPQSMMTDWIWTGNLSSYARFCKQRMGSHAQNESTDIAKLVSDIIEPLFPVSWAALMKY